MSRPRPAVPAYRHHKSTGRAYVLVGGRFVYLGKFDSPESREAYARLIRTLPATGAAAVSPTVAAGRPVGPLTVAQVAAGFWAHAKATYPYDPEHAGRRPPGEIGNYHDALRPLLKLYGGTPAAEFGPLALQAVQAEMVAMGWCRNVVNRHTSRVRAVFAWAVSQELLPGEVDHRLRTVKGIRRGRQGVRDTAPVRPVAGDVLAATLPHLPRRVAAMVRLQLLTGMRSGELCVLRTADVDRSGGVWVYRPRTHKTAHHGHEHAVRLGPKAQDELRPYLDDDDLEAFCFSPAAGEAERRAARTAARVTPAGRGNRPGTNRADRRRRPPAARYTPRTYAQAVARACDRAFPAPDPIGRRADETGTAWRARLTPDQSVELAAWQSARRWHPHQLRHNKGTAVRAKHGVEGVLAALGQRTAAMADRYAEIEADKAERIAAELG